MPGALVVNKEERAVLHNGTAECAAENILPQCAFWCAGTVVEEFVCVEFLVPQEFEYVPVEAVGSALERHVDDRAIAVTELSGSVPRQHFHFGERIDVGI